MTTSQGIMLSSNAGVQRFYRGIVRNVEQTDDPALSEALARIPDIDAKDARSFLSRLEREDSCFLLHLSEGVTRAGQADSIARRHFLALEVAPDEWAINDRFAGIHSAGLLPEDFLVLGQRGGSMVWSPLSNLLLYGETARVDAAKREGVRIALGSDWSPSGSKNLLGELKVAWLYSQHLLDGVFSARDIVSMATRDAAAILKWQAALGTLERGKRADLLVIEGTKGDPYEALIKAKETSIRLVMINGIARYGTPALMKALGPDGETLRVGGRERKLYLQQDTADPDVASVSLSTARAALAQGFPRPAEARARAGEPEARTCARRTAAGGVVAGARRNSAHRDRSTSAPAIQRPGRFHRARYGRRGACRRRLRYRPSFSRLSWTRSRWPMTGTSWRRLRTSRTCPRRCARGWRSFTDASARCSSCC